MTLIVTYLQAVCDNHGRAGFLLASKLLRRELGLHDTFSVMANQVAVEGFLDEDQHVWIAPGAIMSVKERVQ